VRHLRTGDQPENTAPNVEAGAPHVHEDPVIEEDKKVDEGENEEEKKGEDPDDHGHDGEEN
jgi:hypothetical protein